MQRKIICFLIFFMLSALPVHGENAMDYFNLGLKSTITNYKDQILLQGFGAGS